MDFVIVSEPVSPLLCGFGSPVPPCGGYRAVGLRMHLRAASSFGASRSSRRSAICRASKLHRL